MFFKIPPSLHMSFTLVQDNNSTSNCRVALGGIVGGDPDSPYANSGGMVKRAFLPFFIVLIPSSHPLITCPALIMSQSIHYHSYHHNAFNINSHALPKVWFIAL
ncbi:hypothetical protein V8G54_003757 [Vigna mungo]|uniref:Uncharacterized protein n=1 Tax=Vigna mungo TaxID=3915 RepID=A0AAQ3PBG1_VIGMU